jgi:Fe-S-cluster-containing dehydrogenase component
MTGPSVLCIDLDACRNCAVCRVPCSCPAHPGNDGVSAVREQAEFALLCRRCARPPCAAACPSGAIEARPDGSLVRHETRCVSCLSCSIACPFGAILPESVVRSAAKCDRCDGRLENGGQPVCVGGCPNGAIRFGDYPADPSMNRFAVGERLTATARPWTPDSAR